MSIIKTIILNLTNLKKGENNFIINYTYQVNPNEVFSENFSITREAFEEGKVDFNSSEVITFEEDSFLFEINFSQEIKNFTLFKNNVETTDYKNLSENNKTIILNLTNLKKGENNFIINYTYQVNPNEVFSENFSITREAFEEGKVDFNSSEVITFEEDSFLFEINFSQEIKNFTLFKNNVETTDYKNLSENNKTIILNLTNLEEGENDFTINYTYKSNPTKTFTRTFKIIKLGDNSDIIFEKVKTEYNNNFIIKDKNNNITLITTKELNISISKVNGKSLTKINKTSYNFLTNNKVLNFTLYSIEGKKDNEIITLNETKNNVIKNCAELQKIENKSYEIIKDIDCKNTDFTPIQNFQGEIEGYNNIIKNIIIEKNETNYLGIFKKVENSKIKNLILENITIKGQDLVGSLVGYLNDSNVTNLSIKDSDIQAVYGVGGLVGMSKNSILTNVKIENTIVKTKTDVSGGLVGISINTQIKEVETNEVDIQADNYAGGVSGYSKDTTIESSKSNSNIEGYDNLGGAVGKADSTNITNSTLNTTFESKENLSIFNSDKVVGKKEGSSNADEQTSSSSSSKKVEKTSVAAIEINTNEETTMIETKTTEKTKEINIPLVIQTQPRSSETQTSTNKNRETSSRKIVEKNKEEFVTVENLSIENLDFEIEIGNTTNSKNYLIVRNLQLKENQTKTLKLKRTSNSNTICVKDEEVNNIDEVSKECNSLNEFILTCDGKEQYGKYTCNIKDGLYIVSGLSHSAILEFSIIKQIKESPLLFILAFLVLIVSFIFLFKTFFEKKTYSSKKEESKKVSKVFY